jgi:hypothetical protein
LAPDWLLGKKSKIKKIYGGSKTNRIGPRFQAPHSRSKKVTRKRFFKLFFIRPFASLKPSSSHCRPWPVILG